MRRLLAIKFGDLGDALLVAPALAALRERYPDAQIDVLANASASRALVLLPSPTRLVGFEKAAFDRPADVAKPERWRALASLGRSLRERDYEAVALLHHLQTGWGTTKFAGLMLASGVARRVGLDNGRGWFLTERAPDFGFGVRHEADYWLSVAGVLGADPAPRLAPLAIDPADEARADALLAGSARPLVAIHPGSGRFAPARRWGTERFAGVADHVAAAHGATVVLLGGADDDDLPARVAASMRHRPLDLSGRTTLGVLAALLRRCDLFVGNDGGAMHVAAAAGTRVVAIFGPSNHRAWGPYDAGAGRHTVIRRDLPCSPCLYVGFGPGNRDGCATRDCLTALGPGPVLAAVDRALAAPSGTRT